MGSEFKDLLKRWGGEAALRPAESEPDGPPTPKVPPPNEVAIRPDGSPVEVMFQMDSALRVPLDTVVYPPGFMDGLKRRFTLPWSAGKWIMGRRPLGDQPATVNLFYEWAPRSPDGPETFSARELVFPRGAVRRVVDYFQAAGYRVVIHDAAAAVPVKNPLFSCQELTARHQAVADEFVGKRFGILLGASGDDLFPVVCTILARRGQRVLVVVKTRERMYLWKLALERYLTPAGAGAGPGFVPGAPQSPLRGHDSDHRAQTPSFNVGLVGDYHDEMDCDVVVGIDKTLFKRMEAVRTGFGCLVVDRCHQANPKIFFTLVWQCAARFLLGVGTGPPGLDPGWFPVMFLGETVRLPRSGVGERMAPVDRPRVQVMETQFLGDPGLEYAGVLSMLSADACRNQQLVGDILRATAANPHGRVVVTAARLDQLETIRAALEKNYRKAVILTGRRRPGPKTKKEAGSLPPGGSVVLVTHKGIAGLTIDPVMLVVVAAPFKYRPVAAAIAGMLAPGGVVVEYRDTHKLLSESLDRRLSFYRGIGLVVE